LHILQADALGGAAVLAFVSQGTLVVAVDENKTSMQATSPDLFPMHLNSNKLQQNIVFARSYAEAAGIIAAHKAGILLESITSTVTSIPIEELHD